MNEEKRLLKLGKKIREIRKDQGVSQLNLSLDAGVNRNYISDLENGRRNPSILVLYRLADALDVKITDFFTE
ncbi:MAG: helix-turn-helix domain-containing protein [Bacilli bacterium]|jgi:transcriptional regulator with XRE-family HTH domain